MSERISEWVSICILIKYRFGITRMHQKFQPNYKRNPASFIPNDFQFMFTLRSCCWSYFHFLQNTWGLDGTSERQGHAEVGCVGG